MKKILLLASLFVLALSCTKNDSELNSTSLFEKGQKVTLSASMSTSETKAKGNDLGFVWEDGDKVKVTVDEQSSNFTLVGSSGYSYADFEGTMPASGDTYDVQYPVETPDLSTQVYNPDGAPSGKMLATASGCKFGESFQLTPQYAVVLLQFYGGQTIGTLNLTLGGQSGQTYSLYCGENGVLTNYTADNPTLFYIVVNPGTELDLSFEILNTAGSSIFTQTASSPVSPEAGKLLKMAKTEVPCASISFDPNDYYIGSTDPDSPHQTETGNGYWGTICLPYNADVTAAGLYRIAGIAADGAKYKIILVEEHNLQAGVPYLYKAEGEEYQNGVGQTPDFEPAQNVTWEYVGTYVEQYPTGDGILCVLDADAEGNPIFRRTRTGDYFVASAYRSLFRLTITE